MLVFFFYRRRRLLERSVLTFGTYQKNLGTRPAGHGAVMWVISCQIGQNSGKIPYQLVVSIA